MGMVSWLRRKLLLSEAHADLDFMVEKKAAQEAVAKSNTIIASEAKKQKELGVDDADIIRALRMDWKDPSDDSATAASAEVNWVELFKDLTAEQKKEIKKLL